MRSLPVNLSKLIFDNITADNFEHRNLPYGMILTILFDFWGVDLSGPLLLLDLSIGVS